MQARTRIPLQWLAVIGAVALIATGCAGQPRPSLPPESICPTTCNFTLTGSGFYRESIDVDPLEGATNFTGQGCIGELTNWALTSCSGSGQVVTTIGQVNETYRGVDGSTSDGCAFNSDPTLSFDVSPTVALGRPQGTTNVHGLSYQGPLEVFTSMGGQGLAVAGMDSTTAGQVTCIGSKETAGGGVIVVPLVAGFACGPVTELGPPEVSPPPAGSWSQGPVQPTLTDSSKGQYSAKFDCYYGPDHEGTGMLDIEISTQ